MAKALVALPFTVQVFSYRCPVRLNFVVDMTLYRLDIRLRGPNLTHMSDALQYLTDEDGTKTAVVLPITDYEKLLEDLDDLAAIAERRDEPAIPHEQFKAELKRDGIL